MAISEASSNTDPGQRQQAPQYWHSKINPVTGMKSARLQIAYCMYMRSPPGPIMMGFFSSCNSQATLMFLIHAKLRARWNTL